MKEAIQKIRRSLEATASQPPRSAKEYDDAKEALEALASVEQELEALNLQTSMACQEPADDCECPGCLKADAFHGVER